MLEQHEKLEKRAIPPVSEKRTVPPVPIGGRRTTAAPTWILEDGEWVWSGSFDRYQTWSRREKIQFSKVVLFYLNLRFYILTPGTKLTTKLRLC